MSLATVVFFLYCLGKLQILFTQCGFKFVFMMAEVGAQVGVVYMTVYKLLCTHFSENARLLKTMKYL